jgi:hypothetical protein
LDANDARVITSIVQQDELILACPFTKGRGYELTVPSVPQAWPKMRWIDVLANNSVSPFDILLVTNVRNSSLGEGEQTDAGVLHFANQRLIIGILNETIAIFAEATK